jgi:hypothetical protein
MALSPADIQKLAIEKPKGKRPVYLDERSNDHLLSMIMVLAEELSVTRERADTLERLLESQGVISREKIESFVPNTEQAVERQLRGSEFANRLIRSARQELDGLSGQQKSTEEMADFLKGI